MKRTLIFLLFTFHFISGFINPSLFTSQAQTTRLYTTQQGLTTSDIRGIDIDSRGIAWISGASTLEMFDGNGFYDVSLNDEVNGGHISDVIYNVTEIEPMKYLVSTISGLFAYNLNTNTFTRIFLSEAEKEIKNYSVANIENYPKADCKIVFTEGDGAYVINVKTLEVDSAETARVESKLNAVFIFKSFVDSKGRLWLSDMQNHIRLFDFKTLKQINVNIDPTSAELYGLSGIESIEELDGKIFMGARRGVFCYEEGQDGNPGTISFLDSSSQLGAPVVTMMTTKDHTLLIGTDSRGLWELSTDGILKKYDMPNVRFNMNYAKVKCIQEDCDGNLLIGIHQKGLMVIPPHSDIFRYHAITPDNDGLNASCITSMAVDKDLNYWLGTDGCGVFRTDGFNLASAKPENTGLRSLLVQCVLVDKHQTPWVGTYGGGVQYFDGKEFVVPMTLSSLSSAMIMAMAYDEKGDNVIIGANGMGVYVYNVPSKSMRHIETEMIPNPWITSLYVDNDLHSTLYVGTTSNLFYLDPVTGSHGEIKYDQHRGSAVQCISKFDNNLLIGTNEALLLYNVGTREVTKLVNNKRIMAIEQTESDIWVSTANGIESINKKSLKPTVYSSIGGFYLGEFHRKCSVHPVPDDILFGGDNGIICFTPSLVKHTTSTIHPIVITQLQIGSDKLVAIPDDIGLTHDNNNFSLNFSIPYFADPNRIRYDYILEGYDKEWHTCKMMPEVNYSSLPTGTYTLHIKAFNESDPAHFEEISIDVHVAAPWYGSIWAWLIYIAIFLCIIFLFYHSYKAHQQQQEIIRKAWQNERIKEDRLRMFTSITHELRTPLTMILSPLKQLSSTYSDERIQDLCNVMRRNCDRLLHIVKQVTDIRHIDSGQLKLQFQEVDFLKYANNIFATFKANAELKDISFSIESTENVINIWIDTLQFEKILTNLLSNAFKFTPKGGKVIIRTSVIEQPNEVMELRVYNSGSHIENRDLPNVFERFFQGSNSMKTDAEGNRYEGSGIGLNLVHELVAMHFGEISVHNVEPNGVEFVVLLPLGNSHLKEEDIQKEFAENNEGEDYNETTLTTISDQQPSDVVEGQQVESENKNQKILVVDDDHELCEYISKEMSRFYNVSVAFSGNSAWQMVLQDRPDVIVTDVRMPDGDGIELCKRVKGNPETDYIPVIMLTSESNDETQIKSLNVSVDYFLSKPFNLMILRGIIGQVIRIRENLRQRMSRKDIVNDYDTIKMESADDKLFSRINEQLMKHMDDTEFGVERLADEVGISRVHLNRKMKERYGISPRQFIKSFKLKQAAYLLVHNNVNVSEVVYKLGFSSHSFFSSSFHEYFGLTPKEFVAKYADNLDDETLQKLLE